MTDTTPYRNTLRAAPGRVHLITWSAFGFTALLTLLLYVTFRNTDVWFLYFDDSLKSNGPWTEALRGSIFRERANTWSNLGFILVGIYIVAYAWWDARRETTRRDPHVVRHPALMALYGLACIVLGIGSGSMHASLMGWAHKADVFGMFIALATLIALQWGRYITAIPFGGRHWPAWPLLGAVAVVGSMLLINYSKHLGGDIAIFVTLIVVSGITIGADALLGNTTQQYRWIAISYGALALAYYIWRLDVARQFSAPDAWIQGHALWHVLNAVTLGAMAVLYRSESPRPVHPEAQAIST